MTKTLSEYIEEAELAATSNEIEAGDDFVLEINDDVALETYVIESWGDSVLIAADEGALQFLANYSQQLAEGFNSDIEMELHKLTKAPDMFDAIYDALGRNDAVGTKLQDMANDISIDRRLHPDDDIEQIIDVLADRLEQEYGDPDLDEAEYQGRKVALGKPMAGDVKKSKVYVRKPNGKVVKVNFGDKKLSIKKHIPGRRKNFRARHNCDNPGPRWKARYWSCRAW